MEFWCELTVVSSSSPARAQLEVNMEDRVEVRIGKTAQITCTFVSSEGIGAMIIQWFYVSPLGGGRGGGNMEVELNISLCSLGDPES